MPMMMVAYPGSHFFAKSEMGRELPAPQFSVDIAGWYKFWVCFQLKTSEFLKINLHKEKLIMLLWLLNSSTLQIR